jgi:Tfp pilus assembly protein PilF
MSGFSVPRPVLAPPVRAESDPFLLALRRLNAERPIGDRELRKIAFDVFANRIAAAETPLRDYLTHHPKDPDAIWLTARIRLAHGRREDALEHLNECLGLAPDFAAARYELAGQLLQVNQLENAQYHIDDLLSRDGSNPLFRRFKANLLQMTGCYEHALEIFRALLEESPTRAESWVSYGHALRAAGAPETESAEAYRTAIGLQPTYGRAYWSLANMKTFRFTEQEIAAIQDQLQRPELRQEDRIALHFSLGKAFEDMAEYCRSFENYAKGNAAARLRITYDPEQTSARAAAMRAIFTKGFFADRAGVGNATTDPIFVVGFPRSGSTLVEQILSSHSLIEGTAELPCLSDLARQIGERTGVAYPAGLSAVDRAALAGLGEEYLKNTRIYRRSDRPFFIDKTPNNFWHVAMIQLILPNAKIIDVRRHPMACGLSMFRQYFAKTNLRLGELGRAWRDYAELMAHFDTVLPGKVYRVAYERLVEDPEGEIRKLLDYLGLPFGEACLTFYETRRSVRTPSAEQVRRPISRDAVDHWRNYQPWLGPLMQGLGPLFTG